MKVVKRKFRRHFAGDDRVKLLINEDRGIIVEI